jgi:methionine synthase II (cobalamin-independent)
VRPGFATPGEMRQTQQRVCTGPVTYTGQAMIQDDIANFVNYAQRVGRENVQAGTDCGMGSRVGHEEIVWAKLKAMAEGARLASQRLWSS